MHKTIQSMRLCEAAAVGEKRKERKEEEFVAILWQWQVVCFLESHRSMSDIWQTPHMLLGERCSNSSSQASTAALCIPGERQAAQTKLTQIKIWHERQIYDKALAIGHGQEARPKIQVHGCRGKSGPCTGH